MIEGLLLPLAVILGIISFIAILFSIYKIVPANFADVVVQSKKTRVFSSDKKHSGEGEYSSGSRSAYFKIPSFIPGFGMHVHPMPLEILPINVPDFKAFDIDRARFLCDIMAYVAITDPVTAAKRFNGDMKELSEQVSKVVQATTRDSTTKKTVREIINDREGIIAEIKKPLQDAISNWGLALKDIELVEFKDADGTHVIADISSIIEEQINSEARQKNAEQRKMARLKEAIADESARKREIERDEEVSKREQMRDKLVAEKEKEAVNQKLEVVKVEKVKNQEIEKEKAAVLAEQEKVVARIDAEKRKDVEQINKEQKRLEGEGDKIRELERAKGKAAPIIEVGSAEAEIILKKLQSEAKGKDDLQKALNRFDDNAIRALVAELIVNKDLEVGKALAKALEYADMKVFAGNGAKDGFDLGKLIESINVSSPDTSRAIVHKMGKPNDLGFVEGFAVGKELPKKTRKPSNDKSNKSQKKNKPSITKGGLESLRDLETTKMKMEKAQRTIDKNKGRE